jgi:hypothetical protein
MFRTKVVGKIKTRVLYSVFFFFENRAVCEDNVEKYGEPDRPQMAHEHCMPDANAHNMQHLFLFHCNSCTNVSQCYDIHTLSC